MMSLPAYFKRHPVLLNHKSEVGLVIGDKTIYSSLDYGIINQPFPLDRPLAKE